MLRAVQQRRAGRKRSSGHQRRLEIDFTSMALAILSQRVAIFFFDDHNPLETGELREMRDTLTLYGNAVY